MLPPRVTRDVILTVGLLLTAGLAARVLADLLRLPEMIVLLAVGALLGPERARRHRELDLRRGALGAPNTELMAAVVAVAIVATLALQAAPAPWLARRLDLLEPATEPRG